jgi:hypothetical protein
MIIILMSNGKYKNRHTKSTLTVLGVELFTGSDTLCADTAGDTVDCLCGSPKFFGKYWAMSVPSRRCRDESKIFRFFVVIFSQMPMCLASVSGTNVRAHIGHSCNGRLGCDGMSAMAKQLLLLVD